jgi:hypothetical protein
MTALRKRMTEDMQLRNFSPQTQRTYLHHIAGLAQFYQTSPNIWTWRICANTRFTWPASAGIPPSP